MKGTTVLEQHENGEFTKTIEPADLRAKHTKSAALWIPTVELSAWQQNPRDNDHAVPEVVKSIKRFGFAAPIIASPDGQIIAGHTRLKAALELRMPEVPVRFMDLDPGEAHLLALADNRIAEIADWDDDLLGDVLRDMEAEGLDLSGIGWDVDELAGLLGHHDPLPGDGDAEEERDLDAIPEEVPAITKPGEVVTLGRHTLHCGDCLEVMRSMPDASVDAIVTDPPYGIAFMGRDWDCSVPGDEFASEALRVLKPGGHLIAFAATRTVHRLTVALEDAGLEIRDQIAWVQWQGFPKSHALGAAIDKQQGRLHISVVALKKKLRALFDDSGKSRKTIDAECGFRACNYLSYPEPGKQPDPWFNVLPSQAKWRVMKQVLGVGGTDMEAQLDGFFAEAEREVIGFRKVIPGVAFSSDGPSEMPVTLPATEDAKKWEGWGTALKPAYEPCVLARKPLEGTVAENVLAHGVGGINIDGCRYAYGDPAWPGPGDSTTHLASETMEHRTYNATSYEFGGSYNPSALGRWPANLYACPKASRGEREAGCEELPGKDRAELTGREAGSAGLVGSDGSGNNPYTGANWSKPTRNHHPTVKPVGLMRWLVRLVTPPGATVLEPFCGSGTTLLAAEAEGVTCIGIEREPGYCDIVRARFDGLED